MCIGMCTMFGGVVGIATDQLVLRVREARRGKQCYAEGDGRYPRNMHSLVLPVPDP